MDPGLNLPNLEFVTDHLSKQEETEGASEISETMNKMELETASSVVLTYFFLINLLLIHIFVPKDAAEKSEPIQTTEKEESTKPSLSLRHCAFCLRLEKYKLCSGCHKRAYCSKKCQLADWSLTGIGQHHKSWCKLDCGEEDIDFEVVPVPGKGLGLVAKKLIPAKYRIIVEGYHTDPLAHPAIKDLFPSHGCLEEKFLTNAIDHDDVTVIGLRISRANHDCYFNAVVNFSISHADKSVLVLYANRYIQIGEEICTSYTSSLEMDAVRPYIGMNPDKELKLIEDTIERQYGIICQSDCVCQDVTVRQMVQKGRRISDNIPNQMLNGEPMAALHGLKQLLTIQKMVPTPLKTIANTHLKVTNIAWNGHWWEEALYHTRSAFEILSSIIPNNDQVIKLKENIEYFSMKLSSH